MINFEINLIFLIRPFFLHGQKSNTKIWIFWERRELIGWNKKQFSLLLKGFHWSKYSNFFGRGESDFKFHKLNQKGTEKNVTDVIFLWIFQFFPNSYFQELFWMSKGDAAYNDCSRNLRKIKGKHPWRSTLWIYWLKGCNFNDERPSGILQGWTPSSSTWRVNPPLDITHHLNLILIIPPLMISL